MHMLKVKTCVVSTYLREWWRHELLKAHVAHDLRTSSMNPNATDGVASNVLWGIWARRGAA